MKREFKVSIDGKENHITVLDQNGSSFLLEINGKEFSASVSSAFTVQSSTSCGSSPVFQVESKAALSPDIITAPFAGIVSQLKVKQGSKLEPGQELLVIEAMKMENPIKSTSQGEVAECFVAVGTEVKKGQPLIRLKL